MFELKERSFYKKPSYQKRTENKKGGAKYEKLKIKKIKKYTHFVCFFLVF